MTGQQPSDANMQDEEAKLWYRLVSHQDAEARSRLIERHLETAHKVAASLYAKRFNNTVDFGDYLQYARVGLVEAVDRFDPDRSVSFATYASHRIRGAILTGLEHATEYAEQHTQRRRSARDRLKSIRENIAQDDAFSAMADVAASLAIGYMLEESGLWRTGSDDESADPYRSLEMRQLAERIGVIVWALPERERLIVQYHYFEHMDFVAISKLLGVSKGRVSQLHTRALRLVRDAYRAATQFDVRV